MKEINLKKKNMRREAHFDKSNLLTKNGADLIANKFKFISSISFLIVRNQSSFNGFLLKYENFI